MQPFKKSRVGVMIRPKYSAKSYILIEIAAA